MVKNRMRSIIVALILLICCTGVQGASNNLLRLEGSCGWTQHIDVSQGTTAYLVVLAAKEGIGCLNELSPDGCEHNYNYFFCSYDRLPFYADEPGRHVLSYSIDGKESNPVVIDVVGTYSPDDRPSMSQDGKQMDHKNIRSMMGGREMEGNSGAKVVLVNIHV
jgi:hypothetical protein